MYSRVTLLEIDTMRVSIDEALELFLEETHVGHDQIDARQMLLVAEGNAEIDLQP